MSYNIPAIDGHLSVEQGIGDNALSLTAFTTYENISVEMTFEQANALASTILMLTGSAE